MSHKSTRIAELIEACRGQDLDAHYLGFFESFNQGRYYEAHEVLEDLWLQDKKGPDGDFYKGLIQLAGALVHWQKQRPGPAAALFILARRHLGKYPGRHHRLDLDRAREQIGDWLVQLNRGGVIDHPLGPQPSPRLELEPPGAVKRRAIVIAGGSGFIGQALCRALVADGRAVSILTRAPRERGDGARELRWDGESAGDWVAALEGAAAVINLTGRSINCRHTPENLRVIVDSRVNSIRALADGMRRVKAPPGVWVQAGATGYYGDTGDRICDESAPNGDDPLARICREWEEAFTAANVPGTRRVGLRLGFVLGRESGALPVLARLTRWFLGGAAGSGRQFISWIHLADVVRALAAAVEQPAWHGVYNVVAPDPVTNAVFMRELRRVLRRPWSPPAPAPAVRWGARLMGTEGSLALVSQRCSPRRLREAGFKFQFPDLPPALRNLCR